MADSNKKDEFDIFIAQSVYPEAASVFTSQLKSLDEIKDDCLIVLDTNVLLAPYIIGKEDPGKDDLLEECRKIYKSLIEMKRLIIPGQVAREFANRRVDKIAELYQQLSDKKAKIQQIARGKYPLLNSLSEYQVVEHLQEEINKKIREYQEAVNKVLAHVQRWQLNDPVRSLYHELFNEDAIFDPRFDKEETKKDLHRRALHSIPPGYKDRGKEDSGIGDLLLWYTILELGKGHKKSVIFVSGDEKPDWFKQSQNVALHLRYELVDEFRRKSEGQSFHVVKFSKFLELYGASNKIVEEVRREETLLEPHYKRTIPHAVKKDVWERDRGRCQVCGSPSDLGFVYIIPLSEGGTNSPENLLLLCQNCLAKREDVTYTGTLQILDLQSFGTSECIFIDESSNKKLAIHAPEKFTPFFEALGIDDIHRVKAKIAYDVLEKHYILQSCILLDTELQCDWCNEQFSHLEYSNTLDEKCFCSEDCMDNNEMFEYQMGKKD